MTETLTAKLHRVVGGYLCFVRRHHNLVLAEHHWYERTGVSHGSEAAGLRVTFHEVVHRSARRPACTTCWQLPGD